MRATQTGYKRARGAVIVNVHSRYILIAAAYIIETEGKRGDGEKEREKRGESWRKEGDERSLGGR